MCKKDYTPQMNAYLKEVSFRIVFYSLPDFKDNFIKYNQKRLREYIFDKLEKVRFIFSFIDKLGSLEYGSLFNS